MHMTNGASFNLTNKKHINNETNPSNQSEGHYNNQVFIAGSTQAGSNSGNTSEGQGFNIKNAKNVLSGPLH